MLFRILAIIKYMQNRVHLKHLLIVILQKLAQRVVLQNIDIKMKVKNLLAKLKYLHLRKISWYINME